MHEGDPAPAWLEVLETTLTRAKEVRALLAEQGIEVRLGRRQACTTSR